MKSSRDRSALLAAGVILLAVGLTAYFMPAIMLALGEISPALAGLFAVLAVGAFFAVFWLRSRYRRGGDTD